MFTFIYFYNKTPEYLGFPSFSSEKSSFSLDFLYLSMIFCYFPLHIQWCPAKRINAAATVTTILDQVVDTELSQVNTIISIASMPLQMQPCLGMHVFAVFFAILMCFLLFFCIFFFLAMLKSFKRLSLIMFFVLFIG